MSLSNIKRAFAASLLVPLLFPAAVRAEEKKDDVIDRIKTPPGMSVRKVGSFYVLTADDAEITKRGDMDQIIAPEGPQEYAARKFATTEERFKRIEDDIASLKKDVSEIKKALAPAQEQR
jgi:hypothetical protein